MQEDDFWANSKQIYKAIDTNCWNIDQNKAVITSFQTYTHARARTRAKIIFREVSFRKVSRKRRGKRRGAVQYSTTTTTTTTSK